MGTLDSPAGNVKRKIKVVDVSGLSAAQIESAYNTNYGQKGWRIIQIVVLGGNPYVIAEKEE